MRSAEGARVTIAKAKPKAAAKPAVRHKLRYIAGGILVVVIVVVAAVLLIDRRRKLGEGGGDEAESGPLRRPPATPLGRPGRRGGVRRAQVMAACEIAVRLQPRARANEIVGERDGVVVVRVTAPPVDGRANEALCRLIAKRAVWACERVSVLREPGRARRWCASRASTRAQLRAALEL